MGITKAEQAILAELRIVAADSAIKMRDVMKWNATGTAAIVLVSLLAIFMAFVIIVGTWAIVRYFRATYPVKRRPRKGCR